MLTRKLKHFAMLTGSILFAIYLSPCGPQGELLEVVQLRNIHLKSPYSLIADCEHSIYFFGLSPPAQAMNSHLPFSLISTSV